MNDLDTNSLIWGVFMSATLDAAVHLGKDYLENLHSMKIRHERKDTCTCHRSSSQIKQRFKEYQDWLAHTPWAKDNFLSDKAIQLSTAKVYEFSDAVLCLGKMNPHPESIDAWKKED